MHEAVAAAEVAETGARPVAAAPRRAAALLIVLVTVGVAWAALQLHGLSASPFYTRGEPREAVVVQDLVHHGEWILPRRNGTQLPRKPPLFYWLAGVAAQARGGVDEASVRLPSAVLSGASCLLVAAVTTVLYGAVAGAVSGLTLLTSFEWLRAATAARVDMTLVFGLTLVFAGLLLFRRVEHARWLVLAYAGAAWATLGKGIPGLAIPALQVVLLCLVVDRSPAFGWRLRPLSGLTAVLLVSGAWYVAAALQGGRAFVSIVVNENLVRALGERHFALGHRHSLAYLVVALAAGLLPWTLLLPSAALALWRERHTIDRWDPRLFSLLWIAAVFAPFAVAASKRGVYLLPLYPAVALLLGWWAALLVRGGVPVRWLRYALVAVGWALAVVLGLLALLASAQALGLPLLDAVAPFFDRRAAFDIGSVARAAARLPGLVTCLTIATAAAVGLAIAAALRRWAVAMVCVFACTAAVGVGVRAVILPAVAEAYTRRPFAAALRRVVGEAGRLSTTDALDYGTLFYWGGAMPIFDPERDTAPPALLLPESEWLHMSPMQRRPYRRVPGLTIERDNNQGYVTVIQRVDEAERERQAD